MRIKGQPPIALDRQEVLRALGQKNMPLAYVHHQLRQVYEAGDLPWGFTPIWLAMRVLYWFMESIAGKDAMEMRPSAMLGRDDRSL